MSQSMPKGSFRTYVKRFAYQFGRDVIERLGETVIAITAIIATLLIQFHNGWIRTDQRWSSIVANLAPSLIIFGVYVAHHLIRTPVLLDAERATDLQNAIREHKRQTTDLNTGIRQLNERLEEETTKPELHGTINQFYIEPKDGLVTIELSLWNTKRTSTSVQQFTIKIFAGEEWYEGTETPCGSYFFLPLGFSEDDAIPLSALELHHRPLPDGYRQGQIEEERWLCFVIIDNLPRDLKLTKITLTALDVFDIAHEITCEPPPSIFGRIVRIGQAAT